MIAVSYRNTHVDLPHLPSDEYLFDQQSLGTPPPPSSSSPPSFQDAMNERMTATVDFSPTVTVEFTHRTRVTRMTTSVTRHMITNDVTVCNEIVVQWNLLSRSSSPSKGAVEDLPVPITIEPSTKKEHTLQSAIPSRVPESAFHRTSRLWYTLDTEITCHKGSFFSSSTAVTEQHSEEVPVTRARLVDSITVRPVSAKSLLPGRLKISVSYPQRHVTLQPGTEIPITIVTTLLEKPTRLNFVKFHVAQVHNENVVQTPLLNVFSYRQITPELEKLDEMELDSAREQGYHVISHFLDSTHKGNLLIPGAEETALEYTPRLDSETVAKLSATTSFGHPLHVTHRLVVTLRFSFLELNGKTNQKMRRYVDLTVATPLVLERVRIEPKISFNDFLLCEYPRLRDTVFENDFANDSAPEYGQTEDTD